MTGDEMGVHVPYDPEKEKFLNNFYTRFPCSAEHQGLARMVSAQYWDRTHREVYRGFCDDEQDFKEFCSKYSDKYLDEAPSQFFAELDRTVVEVGHSLECIMVKVKALEVASEHLFESDEKRQDAKLISQDLNNFLTPVYVALRLKGYNRKELWG